VGDVHFGVDSPNTLRPHLAELAEKADLLLVAGDVTTCGQPAEAEALAAELEGIAVPVVAVLGNHDYHAGYEDDVAAALESTGARVLEGDAVTIAVDGARVGVAGIKGFGGGFAGACGSDFGEPEMKAFVRHTKERAQALERALKELDADVKIALLHYSPVKSTLLGERLELYPFLGSYLLGEAVDRGGAQLVVHGHAHRGIEKGVTPGGVHVRNVAQPVLRRAFALYALAPSTAKSATTGARAART
jgi:Icc-related predicted phosphoesterase